MAKVLRVTRTIVIEGDPEKVLANLSRAYVPTEGRSYQHGGLAYSRITCTKRVDEEIEVPDAPPTQAD